MADLDVTMPSQVEETVRNKRSKRSDSQEPSSPAKGSARRKQAQPAKGASEETTGGSTLARKKAALAAAAAAKTASSEPATPAKKSGGKKGVAARSGASANEAEGGAKKPRKPHRFRPGTRALIEIRKEQRSVKPMFRKLPFQRLVREITQDVVKELNINGGEDFRFQRETMEVLQEAAEAAGVTLMEGVNHMARHRKRETILPKDIERWLFVLRDAGLQSAFISKGGSVKPKK